MAFDYLQRRRINSSLVRLKLQPPASSSLLESLQVHSKDEFPIMGLDDGTLVPPLACSFCKVSGLGHVLGLVDENGYVVVYNTNKTRDDATDNYWRAHNNAVFDLDWMYGEEKLLTASGDQTVVLWDVQSEKDIDTFKGHTSSVRSVSFRHEDKAVFVSGSRDGHIRIWDRRCNKKEKTVSSVNVVRNAHSLPQQALMKRRKNRQGLAPAQDSQQSVTSVVFQSDFHLVSAGAVDGCVKVWDLRKNYSLSTADSVCLYKFPYEGQSRRSHGFSNLVFDSSFTRLFASCTDDVIYMYDMASYNTHPVRTYRGHSNSSFYVKAVVSPDNNFLLSGSSDENAYIWKVNSPNESPVVLKGHRSEVSDVSWCPTDMFKLVTLSDDNFMRIWRHDPTKMFRQSQDPSVTGTAERTHRDIGISVQSPTCPNTPKQGLKRSATCPVTPVLDGASQITPKRAKSLTSQTKGAPSPVTTVSPSIKTWLKRAASESPSAEPAKQLKLATTASSSCDTVPVSSSKLTLSAKEDSGQSEMIVRNSCKRKLVAESSDPERPCKKQNIYSSPSTQKTEHGNEENECVSGKSRDSVVSTVSTGGQSPSKRESVLKDLDSDINSSPAKDICDYTRNATSTPVRPRKLDLDPKAALSPTANLPNFVMDGLLSASSQRNLRKETANKKGKVDWLTEMRLRKIATDKSVLDVNDKLKQEAPSSSGQLSQLKSPAGGVPSIKSFFTKKLL